MHWAHAGMWNIGFFITFVFQNINPETPKTPNKTGSVGPGGAPVNHNSNMVVRVWSWNLQVTNGWMSRGKVRKWMDQWFVGYNLLKMEFIEVISHLLTIDPNFACHDEKMRRRYTVEPDSQPRIKMSVSVRWQTQSWHGKWVFHPTSI